VKARLEKLLFEAGIGMALFLDFAVGVLIVAAMSVTCGVEVQVWQVLSGGIRALVPDFDIAWQIFRGKYEGLEEHHTTWMHRPLFLLPVATFASWWFEGTFWAIVTFLCVFWHFVHDTKGFGDDDLTWFRWRGKEWSLFGPRDRWSPIPLEHWLKTKWLVPSNRSLWEIAIGSVALAIGIGIHYGVQIGLLLAALVWGGTIIVWLTHHFIPKK